MAGKRRWTSSTRAEDLGRTLFDLRRAAPNEFLLEKSALQSRVDAITKPRPLWLSVANIGPGILVMLADTDADNVVTAAQRGAQWGYRLLPLLLGLGLGVAIPILPQPTA